MMESSVPPSTQSQPEKLDQLISMGYHMHQCLKALEVADGDLEQAVGYLLMRETSQRAFDFSSTELVADGGAAASVLPPTGTSDEIIEGESSSRGISGLPQPLHRHELVLLDAYGSSPEDQLLIMGYSRSQAIQALRVAEGDMEQATNFLLMGNSRRGFLLDLEHFSSARHLRGSSLTADESDEVASESRPAVADGRSMSGDSVDIQTTCLTPVVVSPSRNPPPYTGPKPKIVSSKSFLNVSTAGPFCACFAASRFLDGGVVTAPFLNDIMESSIELYRKSNQQFTIENVLKVYGKSHLGIQALVSGDEEPKLGVHIGNALQQEQGIRKLMAACRNEQQTGWQVILLELQNDSFCTCFPPKGTGSKFWFFDFCHRSSVRSPGSYALVHNSLLQMEETIESIIGAIGRREERDCVPFALYTIKKRG
jgi:UBA/TS-N domain